jgi:glycosyltransferase involved in cell wall biosynthesis
LGIEHEVILLGFCINPYPYIKHCDIYVQPSRHEGYCTTITEARILKKPIVATRVSGVSEQIKDMITGRIAEISVESIAGTLSELISAPKLIKEYENALMNESVNFNSELEKLYQLL